jgi:hypothetical protein
LLAAILASSVNSFTEEELCNGPNLIPPSPQASGESQQWSGPQISRYFFLLSKEFLERNDYTVNPDLQAIQALLLHQYCTSVFLGQGERASPQLWMIMNLAVSIGLHRDGFLYGLSKKVVERRKFVLTGILVIQR